MDSLLYQARSWCFPGHYSSYLKPRREQEKQRGRAGVLGEEVTNGFSVVTSVSKDTVNRWKRTEASVQNGQGRGRLTLVRSSEFRGASTRTNPGP